MRNFKITFHCAPDDAGNSAVIIREEAETSQFALRQAVQARRLAGREIITVEIQPDDYETD